MPLAFASLSHGTVAFGFFNIELDLLLLQQHFCFADRFCQAAGDLLLAAGPGDAEVVLPGFTIPDPARAGNVNLAIRGLDRSSFIGATYARFPFPEQPEGFRQQPDGARNQDWAEALIRQYGEPEPLPLRWDRAADTVSVAEYVFDRAGFLTLVAYVDRGGYPRWKDEVRPPYVKALLDRLRGAGAWPPV